MPPRDGWRGPVTVILTVLTGLWIAGVFGLAQFVTWGVEQYLQLDQGRELPGWGWLLGTVLATVFAVTPALLLALIPRLPTARAAGRVWTLATALCAVLGTVRAVVPVPRHEVYLAALALVAGAAALVLSRSGTGRTGTAENPTGTAENPTGTPGTPTGTPGTPTGRARTAAGPFAVAAGLAALLPWLWFGALGGAVETVLAVLAALAVGLLARAVLDERFWAAFPEHRSAWLHIGAAGLVAGVALVPIAAGTGAAGIALAELLVLPPLGFAMAALRRLAGSATPTHWTIGLAAAGPLALADPEELAIVLGFTETPRWILAAALGSLSVGLLIGLGYALSLGRGVRPRRWIGATAAVGLAVAGAAVYLGAGQPGTYGDRLFVVLKRQADLPAATTTASREQRVAAVYRRLVDTAEQSQRSLRRDLRRLHLHYTPYYLVNGLEVDGGDGVRAWLASRPDVDRVLNSPRLRPIPAPATGERGTESGPPGPQWNISMIGADRAWRELGVTGEGIVVGTSDSGVDGGHEALRAGFRGSDDSWYDPWSHSRTPVDHQGHGTHTLASAVGAHNVGVAPGARWVGCVNLERNLGSPARYLDCLQFMLAPFPDGGNPLRDGRPERAPHVLTNSWGCTVVEGCDQRSLRPAVDALTAAGIFVVGGAGNSGPDCRSVTDPPAPYRETLTVGAVDRNDKVADFSSRGPAPDGSTKPDLMAPGVDVLSALPGGGYGRLSGTSMATPHVAGVVALLWSANPKLIGDVARTREILAGTANPVPPVPDAGDCGAPANVTGAGLVNAFRAVQAARTLP